MGNNNNTLVELNNILFQQLHELKSNDLKGEELAKQLAKANTMAKISQVIVKNANVLLNAQIADSERLGCCQDLPSMLQIEGSRKR
jgi:hypothetical protein